MRKSRTHFFLLLAPPTTFSSSALGALREGKERKKKTKRKRGDHAAMNAFSMPMASRRGTCCPEPRSSSSRVVAAAAPRHRATLAVSAVAAAAGRLSTTTPSSSSGAFTAFSLSATRLPATLLSARSCGPAAIKERTIVAVARPQSSGESSSSSQVIFLSFILVALFSPSLSTSRLSRLCLSSRSLAPLLCPSRRSLCKKKKRRGLF